VASSFEVPNVYDYFISWTSELTKRSVAISGYVIMPNHLHVLVKKTTQKDVTFQVEAKTANLHPFVLVIEFLLHNSGLILVL